KQLGLALHSYHDSYKALPPALRCAPGLTCNMTNDRDPNYGPTWAVLILPFIEQKPLFTSFTTGSGLVANDAAYAALTPLPLQLFICPSDQSGKVPIAGTGGFGFTNTMARGNYGVNVGLGRCHSTTDNSFGTSATRGPFSFPLNPNNQTAALQGGPSLSQITDGTSNTIFIGELIVSTTGADNSYGAWALSTAATVSGCNGSVNCITGGRRQ